MKSVWLFLLFPMFLLSQAPAGTAEMKINEFLYKQTSTGKDNDEFIEFYVTASGDIENYIFTDQDSGSSHRYFFPAQSVNRGDYIVLHVGEGTSSQNGNVYHYYMGISTMLNDSGGDDLLLLKPDDTDSTDLEGAMVHAIPFDFVQYGTSGDALDTIPTSENGVTVTWDEGENARLLKANKGTSISLTPNSNDSDTSICWEKSATITDSEKATNCPHYTPTLDTNNDTTLTYSMGEINTLLPEIKLTKSSETIYDPINLENNPKAIPGAMKKYSILLTNEGLGATDNDSVHLKDTVPEKMKLCVSTVAKCQEIILSDGAVSSGLSLGSVTYYQDGTVYQPTADVEGFDATITEVKVNLNGSFKESDGTNHPSATIELYMGVE